MTSSLLDARRGSQVPRVSKYPPHPFTAADDAIDLAAAAGLILEPWQCYVLRHGMGHDASGKWTASRVSCWVPRQNGKGAIIEALELYWLFVLGEEVVHSAHENRTAKKAYIRMERLIRRTPELHALVKQYRQTNGERSIELHSGALLEYSTRSDTATRGFSTPKLILDEAQELTADQIAAMMPTLSAMPNWQAWYFGTPPSDPTAWAYNLREDGQAGRPRLAHFDWGADLDLEDAADKAKTFDPETWYQCNPALGGRIDLETVETEVTPSGLGDLFGQERLGVWQPRATVGAGVIDPEHWQGLVLHEVIDRTMPRPADTALGVVINHSRSYSAIVAVGPVKDGRFVVDVVDYRPGTQWLVERIAELRERWNPVAIAMQDKGPTASLLLDLEKAGIKPPEDPERPRRGDLAVPWAQEIAAGYGMFIDAVTQKRLWHLDDAPLNQAVREAGTRPLGSGTAWDYKVKSAAPLIGATQALWAYLTRHELVDQDRDEPFNIW